MRMLTDEEAELLAESVQPIAGQRLDEIEEMTDREAIVFAALTARGLIRQVRVEEPLWSDEEWEYFEYADANEATPLGLLALRCWRVARLAGVRLSA